MSAPWSLVLGVVVLAAAYGLARMERAMDNGRQNDSDDFLGQVIDLRYWAVVLLGGILGIVIIVDALIKLF